MLHMQQYDIVVFCPISAFHTHSGDPARLDDLMYHRRYEWLLRGMLAEWNRGADAAYIELHNEGIESRLEILLPLAGLG